MDVQQITMKPAEANAKLAAFRSRLAKMKHSKAAQDIRREYEAALQGYKALAKGTPLIDLEDVIQNAPVDEKGRPRISIGRADARQACLTWSGNSQQIIFSTADSWRQSQASRRIAVNMNRDNPNPMRHHRNKENQVVWSGRDGLEGYALIPMVPLDVRPATGRLADMFVLWEVEQWADRRIGAKPDIDPYLLKHVGGSLYAVLAEWDLTPLERAIMKGRATAS